ncbi:MAG TPA: porin PorA family protein [Yinghuangia sp.]|uniref:porin PorA family protein n=1 Tax=Yinghuangia sp. YIM S10712 TaxID=3436930 RepID=UPI002C812890|nr:porin PorA family protein [Yinghuangia sp.]
MRRASWIISSVSVLLVAAGAVSKFAVYPQLHQMPDDLDGNMEFRGVLTAMDPQAVQRGDFAQAIIRDLPVTADRNVKAVHTSGSTIVLNDRTEIYGPTRQVVSTTEHQYALHRENALERPAPEGVKAEPHGGLTAAFPLSPEKRDYPFWDAETQKPVDAKYTGTEKREGRTVYVYTITAQGPLADPVLVSALPTELPKAALQAINPSAALADAPDMVPLTYISTTRMVGYVDSETGVAIALESDKSVTAQAQGVEVFPVAQGKLTTTEASQKDLADQAATAAMAFWLLSDAGPYGAWALAALLILLAVWLEYRGRRAQAADGATPVPQQRDAAEPEPRTGETVTAGATRTESPAEQQP